MANNYCTIAQFGMFFDRRLIEQLSNDLGSTVPDETTIQFALDTSAEYLDSILSGRYTLPLTTVPKTLTHLVATRAMDILFGRRAETPKWIQDQIEAANAWIEALLNRKVSLPSQTRAQPVVTSSANLEGKSKFDDLPFGFGGTPSSTSTSKGR